MVLGWGRVGRDGRVELVGQPLPAQPAHARRPAAALSSCPRPTASRCPPDVPAPDGQPLRRARPPAHEPEVPFPHDDFYDGDDDDDYATLVAAGLA